MFEATYQMTQKAIFSITASQEGTTTNLLELLQGLIYQQVHSEFSFEPDWIKFCGYGQSASDDQCVKIQTAIMRNENGTMEWALRIKARDCVIRRRNWLVHIGIKIDSMQKAMLYYAQFYYDHLAGSFSVIQPPALSVPSLFFDLMNNRRIICKAGAFPLQAEAVVLDNASLRDFRRLVLDPERHIPVLIISCADLISPSKIAQWTAGNAIVCWFDDFNLLSTINRELEQYIQIKWDSLQVILPFADENRYQPVLSASDIMRMGESQVISLLRQAYCESFRADDRRSFVTVDSIMAVRERNNTATLHEKLSSQSEQLTILRAENTRLSVERDQIKEQYNAVRDLDHQEEMSAYAAILDESMEQSERIRREVGALTQHLYECMGNGFRLNEHGEACLCELQHAILVCFARLGGKR